ncbi:MAG: zinc finger Ran-binding domain-containing protein [Chloroherpetonaceae bacterium]|nr:zinc finger Ran-binding domain-containing protein [Chloroherpetonaceae bacterium]MDW8437895.1 zinc finger protein [Chloroherpetonaceae bacterium]
MASGIRVGRWDCAVCGHKGNLGYETKCSQCGAPRGKNAKFYLPDDSPEVTDEQRLAQARAGADWICDYCGADNKATDAQCRSCGNARTEADIARQTREIRFDAPPSPAPKPLARTNSNKAHYLFGALLLLGVVLFLLFRHRETTVVVTGREWVREIRTEKFIPVIEEGWSVPSGAKLIKSFQDVHHYEQVLAGYETRYRDVKKPVGTERVKVGARDLGNGYFEDIYETRTIYKTVREPYEEPVYRSVPVYATKHRYEIYRWKPDQVYRATGRDLSPQWPNVPPATQTHREAERRETYILHFKDERDNEFSEECDFDFWKSVKDGDRVRAERNAFSIRLKDR